MLLIRILGTGSEGSTWKSFWKADYSVYLGLVTAKTAEIFRRRLFYRHLDGLEQRPAIQIIQDAGSDYQSAT